MNTKEIIIDGKAVNTKENMRFRGAGMVSANNSSRLLLDYKSENPKAYRELLEYIFGDEGIGINHLKIEMGSDINSSSGTEPAVMRSADEKADVRRGAGYRLAADAKEINPDLTLDMLWWSEPKWITDADDVYAARYKWHKETLRAAYEVYGLKFDYISAVQNERAADLHWVKYLSSHLKSEADCPYDYSKIKIVGGEEVCTWGFADRMYEDEELMNAVDVVGSHYTSTSTAAARRLAEEHSKELWFSEASSPMSYAQGTYRLDGKNSGIADINGALDIANR
ncbi:MAG: glycosyl hydrolase family 59, partial [Ruminococcus sp.]|nr:glycosyl hydrolase family 59 [Ruminococcus sp.]